MTRNTLITHPLTTGPLIAGLALLLFGLGCGYRSVGGSRLEAEGIEQIEIKFFENESAQPGFELMLAEALVEEFERRGQLTPLYGRRAGRADLVLAGAIRSVDVRPAAFSSVGLALENEIQVRLRVKLSRRGGDLIWEYERFGLEERFRSSADASVRDSNREQALRKLASDAAGRIHDAITQSF
jgi:ABC-type uncharacterized transport system auxiliary subunit